MLQQVDMARNPWRAMWEQAPGRNCSLLRGRTCRNRLSSRNCGLCWSRFFSGWVGGGRTVDVVYLDFRRVIDTVSHNILVMKLRKCGIDEWIVRWIENWMTGIPQCCDQQCRV